MKLRPLSSPSPLNPAERRRTVVVALRRDAAGRDLLTWALVKAAGAGDRVVAVHVASLGEDEGQNAAETLGSVLGAYRGFCERNQMELELTVRAAPSVKRALVAEAADRAAAHLVLGVAKTSSSARSRSSATAVARYCARRVPATCAVTAVSNGVVVYQRDAAAAAAVHHHQQPSHYSSMVVDTPRRLYRKLLDATALTASGDSNKSRDDLAIGDGRAARRNMSASMSALMSPRVRLLAPATPTRSLQKKQDADAGWPLLRKEFKSQAAAVLPVEEISVVQWAMNLPARCSPVTSSPAIEEDPLPEELVALRDKYSSKYRFFTYSELANITDNFSPARLVGNGGAGRVYRACTDHGTELAVKVLKPSATATREFVAEVEVLSAVAHRNAAALAGLCLHGPTALVYDYVRRGSLEDTLHGENRGGGFGWPERLRVAVGVASALEYLHAGDGGERRAVVHRDVKSSNVLVGDDFEPRLCDFGLAVWADDADAAAQGAAADDVAGTFGYLAPEYFMHGKVSAKMDVYAFGVVLLELVSGRRPVAAAGPKGRESLVVWAASVLHGGKLVDLVDPAMLPLHQADAELVERMALAAALCIRRAPQRRPTMTNVLKLLTGDGEAVKWARSQVVGASVDSDDDHDDCGGVATSPDKNDIQSYINLALLDDDDAGSVSSVDFLGANMSLEEYIKGRWSRSSSFDD